MQHDIGLEDLCKEWWVLEYFFLLLEQLMEVVKYFFSIIRIKML